MKRISTFILTITIFSTFAFGQKIWYATNGPTGGQVNTLFNFKVEGAAVVYAGTPFGLFKSTNSGSTWNPISPELAGKNISSITSFGTTIFVGTKGYGVFVSTDSGKTFSNFNSSSVLGWINSLALSGEILFAGGVGGVMRSNDTGKNWTKVGTLTSGKTITSITTYTDTNSTFIIASDDKGSVYLSADFGTNWVEKNPTQKLGFVERLGHHVLPSTISLPPIWAATRNNGIAVTTDNGATWNFKNNGLPFVYVTNFAFTDANNFIISTLGGGLFKTSDGGNNWVQISNTGLTDQFVNSLILLGANILAATQNGIFQTLLNTISWQPTNTGLLNIAINSFLMIGNSIYAGTSNGIYLSTDFGLNWLLLGLTKTIINTLFPGPAGMLLAGIQTGGLMKSTDNGNNWTAVSGGLLDPFTYVTTGMYNGTNGLYIIGTETKGALVSSDLTIWTNAGALNLQFISDIEECTSDNPKIFAGTSDGLFKSDDGGNNFVKIGFDGKNVIKVNVLDSLKILASTGDSGIFQSTDGGKTWTQKWDNNAKGASVISVSVMSESFWIVMTSKGTFITEDFGETYTNQDTGLILKDVKAILPIVKTNKNTFTNTTYDILGGTNGMSVWRLPNFVVTTIDDNNFTVPYKFSLSQNFPNPFNPSTIIEYNIPAVETGYIPSVQLRIFDILGREVAVLVNEHQKPGYYKVNFDASSLSSGIYFYRISAGKFVSVKKMILLK